MGHVLGFSNQCGGCPSIEGRIGANLVFENLIISSAKRVENFHRAFGAAKGTPIFQYFMFSLFNDIMTIKPCFPIAFQKSDKQQRSIKLDRNIQILSFYFQIIQKLMFS